MVDALEKQDFRHLGLRDRLLALAIPTLLVVLATAGIVRYHELDQSSWRGGSFGMFATYEHDRARTVVITAVHGTERRTVTIPEDLKDLRDRAVVVPHGSAAAELAHRLLDHTGADRVVLEVRGHDVEDASDRDGLDVRVKVLNQVVVP